MARARDEKTNGTRRRTSGNGRADHHLLAALPTAALAVDAHGGVTHWNTALEALTGIQAAEALGRKAWSLFSETRKLTPLEQALRSEEVEVDEAFALRKPDGTACVRFSACPLLEREGVAPRGAVATLTEEGGRVELEAEVSRLEGALTQRVKELACLYAMSDLLGRSHASRDDTLTALVASLPGAVLHPDAAAARIVFDGQTFTTRGFRETQWTLRADIPTDGGASPGSVEVAYLREMPACDEGAFLSEERHLLDTVAARLGDYRKRLLAEEQTAQTMAMAERTTDIVAMADADGHLLYLNAA